MVCRVLRSAFCFLIFLCISFSFCLAQGEFTECRGIIHVHSSLKPGQTVYSLQKLLNSARGKGIKVMVFSDTFLRRLEYRLPWTFKIFKFSLEEESVAKYGIKQYLQDYKKIKAEFPGTVILEGVEVTPYYWWSGNIFRKNLALHDWNKHLLVAGLKTPQDYRHLPVIGNTYMLPKPKDVPFLLLSLLTIALGAFLFADMRKKLLGSLIIVIGILFLLNIFPFSYFSYGTYRGAGKERVYQNVINYVNGKGGLVFWSHPEVARPAFSLGKAKIQLYTPDYPESLILTSGYTGFGVNMLPGTNHDPVLAGQQWDDVLTGYCRGSRNKPVWVVGEADYRGSGPVDAVENIFFLAKLNADSVYHALRSGRLYARYHSEDGIDIALNDFRIQDSHNPGKFAYMGEEIVIESNPRLFVKGDFNIRPPEGLRMEVIRNGRVIQTFSFGSAGKFDIEFQDDLEGVKDKKVYYRINILSGGRLILITNPIFAEIKI